MKYYIGQIEERNGEFDYQAEYLFATEEDPDNYTEKTTKEWRGGDKKDWDEYLLAYWCSGTLISNEGYKEVPKEDFEVLRKYITVL